MKVGDLLVIGNAGYLVNEVNTTHHHFYCFSGFDGSDDQIRFISISNIDASDVSMHIVYNFYTTDGPIANIYNPKIRDDQKTYRVSHKGTTPFISMIIELFRNWKSIMIDKQITSLISH